MLFHALGAAAIEGDDGVVPLGGARTRRLLAALLLHAPETVSTDELVDHVWPDAPPRTAPKTLQTYVMNLRRLLGADRVVTHPTGYALRVAPDEYDVARFETAAKRGRAALGDGLWEEACAAFQEALSLWRGEPFSDLAVTPPLAHRLSELRGYVAVDLAAAEVGAGRVRDAITRLRAELADFPLREELWVLLMAALRRDGRTSEALTAFNQARTVLRDELGVDPGPELRAMHEALLKDDAEQARGPHAPSVTEDRTKLQYARGDRGLVSFQVLGSGQETVLVVPDWFNSIVALHEHEAPRLLLERLGARRQVILFDMTGVGRSDPLQRGQLPSIDDWSRDAAAVLRTAGIERCAVLGSSVGASAAIQLAVAQPHLVGALVLHNPVARTRDTMLARVGYDEVLRLFTEKWATGTAIPSVAASRVNDAEFNAWFGHFMSASISAERLPTLLNTLVFGVDVMASAPRVQCPVLLTVRRDNPILGPGALDALHAALRDAALVTLEGGDHLWFIDDAGDLATAVNDFLGARLPRSA